MADWRDARIAELEAVVERPGERAGSAITNGFV